MRTRQEHIEEFAKDVKWMESSIAVAIDWAIKHGLPTAPEQVEPKVGDELTEATRLVDGMILTDVGMKAHQLNEDEYADEGSDFRWRLWAADRFEGAGVLPDAFGMTIRFVPGEPVTEQKHETTVIKVVGMWDWRCTCGCHGRNYETRSAADYWAEKHGSTHKAVQS